jgi:hypothetical protein
MPTWAIVVTSASVGALISALVTAINQYFERRSRRRELAMSKALEAATEATKMGLEVALKRDEGAYFTDILNTSETYYRWLMYLMDHGALPKDAHAGRTLLEKEHRAKSDK